MLLRDFPVLPLPHHAHPSQTPCRSQPVAAQGLPAAAHPMPPWKHNLISWVTAPQASLMRKALSWGPVPLHQSKHVCKVAKRRSVLHNAQV